jgi:hypothetical protein
MINNWLQRRPALQKLLAEANDGKIQRRIARLAHEAEGASGRLIIFVIADKRGNATCVGYDNDVQIKKLCICDDSDTKPPCRPPSVQW